MDVDATALSAADGVASTAARTEPAPHDHAWRRVRMDHDDDPLRIGEYRCDLCEMTWSL